MYFGKYNQHPNVSESSLTTIQGLDLPHNEAIKFSDIVDAKRRIEGIICETPLLESPLLNDAVGRRVLVKAECLQKTGSFKMRGAASAITALEPTQQKSGVLAYSSGNHAQGIALAAKLAGIESVIVMPNDAPKLKISNTKSYGAEVVLYDRAGGESREALGEALAAERGLHLVKPYDNAHVMAGQGTCGIEIAEQSKQFGVTKCDVLVCCGGGGLTSGIAVSLETLAPQMTVRPVEPDNFDDVIRSQQSGKREQADLNANTSICDAIVTPSPGELTFPIISRLCGMGITVSDEQALKAMQLAMTYLKLVTEPGGAVALAAATASSNRSLSDTVICVVSGGNVDTERLKQALDYQ